MKKMRFDDKKTFCHTQSKIGSWKVIVGPKLRHDNHIESKFEILIIHKNGQEYFLYDNKICKLKINIRMYIYSLELFILQLRIKNLKHNINRDIILQYAI